jgi:hypothetical protein
MAERVALYDIDSRIPNLALMKLSTYYRQRGCEILLCKIHAAQKESQRIDADLCFASSVFYTNQSAARVQTLKRLYNDKIEIGGSGESLSKRLPPEVERCFPDYSLYHHSLYALGFLTRGCNKRCPFCIVPIKEGRLKERSSSFSDFVPSGQGNVMLLDDNLLMFEGVKELLQEMIDRQFAVNFSQTLDIAYLDEQKYDLLRRIDYRNARFNNQMIYFSLNYPGTIEQTLFSNLRPIVPSLGRDDLPL